MILEITYNNGRLNLVLDAFFPTTKARVRKLYKLFFGIGVRPAADYADECIEHIEKRIPEQKQLASALAKSYVNIRTQEEEMNRQVANQKRTNGVPLSKDELKTLKQDLKEITQERKETKRDVNKAARELKLLKENKELLKKLAYGS